ncbi:MAG: amino acid adenylation domain-containing protein [Acidobacteria bacterium]|nr:amino acid adenylation domain-containing protein [Acidobacteriota bacterium]
MMAAGFLTTLQSLGVEVWAAGNRLRYRAPEGTITEALRNEIIRHKEEILAVLERQPASELVRLPSAGICRYPLSPAQERLWFMDQLVPDSPLYNEAIALRLSGALNVSALQQALQELVRRHQALRTSFEIIQGQPYQIISPQLAVNMVTVDLRLLPETEKRQQAAQQIQQWLQPFQLTRLPLLRVGLIALAAREHWLVLILHHIICDGWSKEILTRELSLLYEGYCHNQPVALPEPELQYSDFALWQRERFDKGALDHELAYWRAQLSSTPSVLEIPTNQMRQPVQTYRGDTYTFTLDQDCGDRIRKLGREKGVTPFMILLASWQVLLGRYGGQDEVIVGTIVANRTRAEFAGTVGLMVNTLLMKGDLRGNPSFAEMLARIKDTAIGAYQHQELPFEKLVAELVNERDVNRNPLTEVMFVMEEGLNATVELSGLTVTEEKINTGTAKYDLMLVLKEKEGGFDGRFEYNADLFDKPAIQRMTDAFKTLLASAMVAPEQRIGNLPLLSPSDQQIILGEWNTTNVHYDNGERLHRFFEEQAEKTPDGVAIVYEDEQISYRELNTRANQLAQYLRQLEVGPEALVGLCLERSLQMVISVLAIFKAGGVCLPLDLAYPYDRLAFILDDASPLVLLTDSKLAERLPESAATIVRLDCERELIEAQDSRNPVCSAAAENLAYVIYTSGSTGRPKGVGVPHRTLTNLIAWHSANRLTKARTLQFASMGFDVSFYEIFAALTSGGTLFILPEGYRVDIPGLASYLAENRIEKAILPVVVLQQLAEEQSFCKQDFTSLAEVTTTGEQLQITRPMVKFFESVKHSCLHNDYGPSESHVVTSFSLDAACREWPARPPIGKPIANTQMYILERHLNPLPIGAIGELYISGTGLGRGYLGRADLTAERFLPNPFSERPGERLYKTGDLVCYLDDGNINFFGRADHQVKVRGFRIELGEIESMLAQHPAVREAVVVSREESLGNKYLLAYVAADRKQQVSADEFYHYLKQRLPDYMVPAEFIIMEKLPLTTNGKIDRAALTMSNQPNASQTDDLIPAQTPAEELVAKIWMEVLDLNKVGINSNFFSLGGHSLLASRIILRLREIFRVELPVRSMFETPTVSGLINIMSEIWGGRDIVEEIAWTFMQVEESADEDVDKFLVQNQARWQI